MEKPLIEAAIADGLSTRGLAKRLEISQTNVRHWLNKFGLKTTPRREGNYSHRCEGCGQNDPQLFYGHNKTWCKKCQNRRRSAEFAAKKRRAVEHFGGKCIKCGYNRYYGALEFHHKDDNKEVNPNQALNRRWERAIVELSKCEMVCANCHREIHSLIFEA